ncbi:BamA/TamA family outer membrane protein [Chitinophaga sp. SYP-B3965]|uniref:BamA/TamA family outer membrane protein n=1 Tax=Chitinophaga sp. SYP-B3965 TaxID=2663120 RepID=UPI001563B9B7|nr:BamA/TamA family outer membrane protein [Chitinophaga sp. SYP-B3965]
MRSKLYLLVATLFISSFCYAQSDSIVQRIILIGDAGEIHHGTNPTIDAVRKLIDLNKGKNTVLFLGDNVYPLGLPNVNAPGYKEAQAILDYQAGLLKDTKAEGIFIPGNHDWSRHKPDGWQTIRNQQRYIDSLGWPNLQFLPKDGCPGPIAVPLGKDVVLIVMDSEWWLYPGKKPGIESGCDCKTQDEVLSAINDIAALNPGKLMVFATHHPLRSYGIHGGYYTIKQHIFPLTDAKPGLYIPLPVIGSIYPLVRGVFGTTEDLPHPLYKRMVKGIEEALPKDAQVVFVSGHDHTLQLIKDQGRSYIVSGSGVKNNRVKKGNLSEFASRVNGFTVIEVMTNGNVKANFYNDKDAAPIFSQNLYNLSTYRGREENYPSRKDAPATVTLPPDPQYDKAGSFHRFLLGDNYRKVWATPLTFPVINLDTVKGGLKILKRGGGKQTRSLRLEDKSGNEWVLRSLRKWPTSAMPEALRETFAKEVVQDQISAANPYAPLAVRPFARAAGVPYTNPEFVYLPDDTALGIYRKDFADGVYLLEEREPVSTNKTYNSEKLMENLLEDNDNNLHQPSYLQARLLDMFIADWDRHEDQWRWYAEKDKKKKTFYPIPRDRDQAFFVNEGLIPRLVSRPWLLPAIQGFRKKFPYINGFNFSARFLDRNFLSELDEDAWQKQSTAFAALMTDNLIDEAATQFPDTINKQVSEMMRSTLKVRRDKLPVQAMKYYRFLAKGVDITGTFKDEQFTVTRLPEGKVQVQSQKISKSGDLEQTLYSRTFNPAHTKEIALYGLGGEDKFVIKGEGRSPIRIRIIGGKEKDTYIDSADGGGGKRIFIYDLAHRKDSFAVTGREKLRLSSKPDVIKYDRRAFVYNKVMPLLAAGYNLDDGVSLGLGIQYIGHGFRKDSFAVKHTFTGTHAVATQAYQFRYQGQFNDVIGKTDLLLTGIAKAPHNTVNFFGFGNETEYKDTTDPKIRYYRSRFNIYSVSAALRTNLTQNVTFFAGPTVSAVTLEAEDNENRFLTNYKANMLDSATLFKNKYYAGISAGFNIDTRDNDLNPTRGLLWSTTYQANTGLNKFSNSYSTLRTDMSIYASLGLPASVVLVSRFGGGVTWGQPEFFQSMTLGGTANLRGYRNNRFAGRAMVYNNMELRVKLFDFTSYILPGSVGLIAFNDVGRVWKDGEKSHEWHDGYGGGLYFSPVNMLIITAVVGRSKEETLPYVTFGFKF